MKLNLQLSAKAFGGTIAGPGCRSLLASLCSGFSVLHFHVDSLEDAVPEAALEALYMSGHERVTQVQMLSVSPCSPKNPPRKNSKTQLLGSLMQRPQMFADPDLPMPNM